MLNQSPFIDFHTHSKREGDDIIEVISKHFGQQKDSKFYTIGFHPWWTSNRIVDEYILYIKNMYISDQQCLGIGECGLDNLKGEDIDTQESVFIQQIECANELNAPMVIHCVRAFDRILRLKKELGHTPWVIHGFVRNKILAKQVLDAGCYLSLAPHGSIKSVFEDTLKFVPLDRIFLETDSSTVMSIEQRYFYFSELIGRPVEAVKEQLYQNFKIFFKEKWRHPFG